MFIKSQQAAATVAILSTFLALGCCNKHRDVRSPGPDPNGGKGEALSPPDNSIRPGAIVVRGVKDFNVQLICNATSTGLRTGEPSQYQLEVTKLKTITGDLSVKAASAVQAALGGNQTIGVETSFRDVVRTPLEGVPDHEYFDDACKRNIKSHKKQSKNALAYVYGSVEAVVVHKFNISEEMKAALKAEAPKVSAALGGGYRLTETGELITTSPQVIAYDWQNFDPDR